MFIRNKRGQLTVFIILAVLVVAGVVLAIVLMSDSDDSQAASGDQDIQSPSAFLEGCMEDDVRESMQRLRLMGGFLDASPSINFRFVNDTNPVARDIAYLCYASSSGNACVTQNAALVGGMEDGLESELADTSESCFSNLKDAYRENGYSISGGIYDAENDLVFDLVQDSVEVNVNASEMVLESANETRNINDFKYEISSVTYNLARVANEVVEQERQAGTVDLGQFVIDYPEYRLNYEATPDQSRIYTLTHIDTRTKFRFAVRSYPLA